MSDGLILKIISECDKDPGNGDLYIFRNNRADKLKLLIYDENGFMMMYKRLCKNKFFNPKIDGEILNISQRQVQDLLSGMQIKPEGKKTAKKPHIFH